MLSISLAAQRSNLLIILIFLSSCKKFLSIPPPQTQAQTQQIFENDQAAVSALTGLYNQMLTSNLWITNGGLTVYTGLSADELINTSADANADGFAKNTLLPGNTVLSSNFWIPAYRVIYHANAILQGIESSGAKLTASVSNQVKGEALLVRALQYFYLANLFGDIPLLISPDYRVNSSSPRTPSDEIYQQIIDDLIASKELLKEDYPTTGKLRPNKYAALTLLARVYLFQQQWANAETAATEIIDAGSYELVTDPDQSFQPNSAESIWQLVIDNANTAEGNAFIPVLFFLKPNYAVTQHLLDAFETTDARKTKWLKLSTAGGQNNYYPFKYKMRSTSQPYEYYTVFRLAELFLIRAEARAQQDKLDDAKDDLNTIRNRAGLNDTAAGDKQTLLDAIMHERRTELFAEWGHRWLDLKRTNKANAVLQPIKGSNWQPTDILYPIPQQEINANTSLTQNPGY